MYLIVPKNPVLCSFPKKERSVLHFDFTTYSIRFSSTPKVSFVHSDGKKNKKQKNAINWANANNVILHILIFGFVVMNSLREFLV